MINDIEDLIFSLIKTFNFDRQEAHRFALKMIESKDEYKAKFEKIINCLDSVTFCNDCKLPLIQNNRVCLNCTNSQRILFLFFSLNDYMAMKDVIKNQGTSYFFTKKSRLMIKEINNLKEFIRKHKIKEIIFSFSPIINYENIAAFVHNKIKSDKKILITRLPVGLSPGVNLFYNEEFLLKKAINKREKFG